MTPFGSRRPRHRLVKALLGAGLLSLAFTSTGGSTTPASAHARPAASGHHCIVQISPVLPGQTSSQMSAPRCFATFRQAISAATSGAVRVSSSVTPRTLSARMLRPERLTATVVLSIDYVNSNYQGNTLTWYDSGTAGCAANTYSASSMPSGWNDVISSSHRYDSCTHNPHFENVNFGGAIYPCTCATMGVMNDKTSSEKWS